MARLQQEKQAAVTTGSAGSTGIPCAMVPRGPGFLAPVACKTRKRLCGLSASVGAPGPHDFAVRDRVIRLMTRRVHRVPRPTFVTIAKRPSYRVRDAWMIVLIWG
jgi:hypothetical protein